MLREVTDAMCGPTRKGRESYVERDIIDFAQSGMAVAELVIEGKSWHAVYITARQWTRDHQDKCPGVAVTRRGERIYLVREGK